MRRFLFYVIPMFLPCLLTGSGMKNSASPAASEKTYTIGMPADDPRVLMRMSPDAMDRTMESEDECKTLTFVGNVFPPRGRPIEEIIDEQGSRELQLGT